MKILLVCSGGMSINLLMHRMKAEIVKRKINVHLEAVNETMMERYIGAVDIILLSPQVKHLKKYVKEIFAETVLCIVIDKIDYGMINEVKILNNILNIYNNRRI